MSGCAGIQDFTNHSSYYTPHHQQTKQDDNNEFFFGMLTDPERLFFIAPYETYQTNTDLLGMTEEPLNNPDGVNKLDFVQSPVSADDLSMVPLVCSYTQAGVTAHNSPFPRRRSATQQNAEIIKDDCTPIYYSQNSPVTLSYTVLTKTRSYALDRAEYINETFETDPYNLAPFALLTGWITLPGVTLISLSHYKISHLAQWHKNQAPLIIPVATLIGLIVATTAYLKHNQAITQRSINQLWQDKVGENAPLTRQHDPYGQPHIHYKHLLKVRYQAKSRELTGKVYGFSLDLAREYNEAVILYGEGQKIEQMCLSPEPNTSPQFPSPDSCVTL